MYEMLHDYVQFLLGWPLLIYVGIAGIICTYMLRGIQIFGLSEAFQATLFPKREKIKGDISPLQAFFNTVNASIGNGSIAGMATAIYSGGPGAAFWVLIFGFLLMAVRFAEVYISTDIQNRARNSQANTEVLGGPMLYLKEFPGGNILSMIYAILCFFFGVSIACCWQANSIQLSLHTTIGISPLITGAALFFLVLYIVCGGAGRIAAASTILFPLKVGLFLLSAIAVLIYHASELLPALTTIFVEAFTPSAIAGGVTGISLVHAIRFGMARSVLATESGLGTAAVLFGFTGSKDGRESGYMGMFGAFMSTIVCFIVALCIVASGVANSGLNSTALTIEAYKTVFGSFAGLMISFLSIIFAVGVMVAYGYITRACFRVMTGGRWEWVFILIYSGCAALGTVADIGKILLFGDIVLAIMLVINLAAVVLLLPQFTKEINRAH